MKVHAFEALGIREPELLSLFKDILKCALKSFKYKPFIIAIERNVCQFPSNWRDDIRRFEKRFVK